MFRKLKLVQPYLAAITIGVLIGSTALVTFWNKKATRDDVIYIEIDPSKQTDEDFEEIERIISENPEKDIILTPIKGFKSISPD